MHLTPCAQPRCPTPFRQTLHEMRATFQNPAAIMPGEQRTETSVTLTIGARALRVRGGAAVAVKVVLSAQSIGGRLNADERQMYEYTLAASQQLRTVRQSTLQAAASPRRCAGPRGDVKEVTCPPVQACPNRRGAGSRARARLALFEETRCKRESHDTRLRHAVVEEEAARVA